MKIVFISAAQIPSDTANSIQVMKVCQAFMQLGHEVTLLVPRYGNVMMAFLLSGYFIVSIGFISLRGWWTIHRQRQRTKVAPAV